MFKKLQRQIDRKKAGSQAIKYRFDLHLDSLNGLPKTVTQCRMVWARGAKVQLTKLVWVEDGVAKFGQTLSQVATVYRSPNNQLEGKVQEAPSPFVPLLSLDCLNHFRWTCFPVLSPAGIQLQGGGPDQKGRQQDGHVWQDRSRHRAICSL